MGWLSLLAPRLGEHHRLLGAAVSRQHAQHAHHTVFVPPRLFAQPLHQPLAIGGAFGAERQIRRHFQGREVVGLRAAQALGLTIGFVPALLAGQELHQTPARDAVVGVDLEMLPEQLDGFAPASLALPNPALHEQHAGPDRRQRLGRGERLVGGIPVFQAGLRPRALEPGFAVLLIRLRGQAPSLRHEIGAAQLIRHAGQCARVVGFLGVSGDGGLQCGQRLLRPSQIEQRRTLEPQQPGAVRSQGEPPLREFERTGSIPQTRRQLADALVHRHGLGIQRQRAVVLPQRFTGLARLLQGAARGIVAQRLFIGIGGFGTLAACRGRGPQRQQQRAERDENPHPQSLAWGERFDTPRLRADRGDHTVIAIT